MSRPIASLSMDLDNKWAYLRAAGRPDWAERPGYLPLVIDRIVDVLGELDLPLTVFIVGRDLAGDGNDESEAIRQFGQLQSWEPANHSLNHLPWMHTMEAAEIADEIETTHHRILAATGRRPLGFRGPGFSCPDEVLRVLAEHDYVYDASIFPTSIAPIARMVFLIKSDLKGEQREKAKKLYGGFSSLRQPNRPFRRAVDGHQLWEMPVTVMPITRTPIHFSYFTYLASFSTLAAKTYLRTALRMCKLTNTPPSLLLHPPDFLGHDDDSDMAYFPAMNMSRQEKLSIVRWGLKLYAESFDVSLMIDQLKAADRSIASSIQTQKHTPQPSTVTN
ncbi:Polysaccharide deacetylase [Rubripirellula tenax]|uniref:Polysaccharide deacetylase n=1 Tax=Rubripirellula tenax TaxID=2528015 RepID=A0A5C6FGB7_9BACT|nr:polysaccharide deacetylase family protein [Rubripirellula tenax]TWU59126.1 Polysaccharide deacetylase [Rubripirellula tenax]